MTVAEMEVKNQEAPIRPDALMQLGMGFWASKVFLTAVKLGLFTLLDEGPLPVEKVRTRLGLHPRSTLDFLDTLVALHALAKNGDKYANTPESAVFFSKKSPAYLGDMVQMADERLWDAWGRFEEGLRTGKPQNETRNGGNFFDILYADDRKRRLFLKAMIGLSLGSSMELVKTFDFKSHKVFCDVGGGPGTLAATVARAFPHLQVTNFDLPAAKDVFDEYMKAQGMESRVRWQGGDCLTDPLPPADLYALGHVLHGWGGAEETHLTLKRIYDALPSGGELMVIESLIDDERRVNAFGLLMSLDMMIETPKGRNFTGNELKTWMEKAGFKNVQVRPLAGHGVAVGVKT